MLIYAGLKMKSILIGTRLTGAADLGFSSSDPARGRVGLEISESALKLVFIQKKRALLFH